MKKQISKQVNAETDDMRPEYDFTRITGGVRGKYHQAYQTGHTVKIHKADGTTIVQHFKLEDGAVLLAPDVREYFPDSETVNNVLRALIALIPQRHKALEGGLAAEEAA